MTEKNEIVLENHFGSDYWLIPKEHLPHIFNAMDEWAKIIAIEFKGWHDDKYWSDSFQEDGITKFENAPRYSSDSVNPEYLTTEQLYTLFMQEKNKNA